MRNGKQVRQEAEKHRSLEEVNTGWRVTGRLSVSGGREPGQAARLSWPRTKPHAGLRAVAQTWQVTVQLS